jgi:hypothetical protein
VLLYATRPSEAGLRLVAVEYISPDSFPLPEGFTGDDDVWQSEEPFPIWVLNARIDMAIALSARRSGLLIVTAGCALTLTIRIAADSRAPLDRRLDASLARHGFTGKIASTLEQRIGRRLDHQHADLGRLPASRSKW